MELFEASKSGDESRVSALIASGVAVDAQDSSRRSALHLAAWAGHLGVVKTLLRAQANVKLQAQDGFTALHFAALKSCNPHIAAALLAKDKSLVHSKVKKGNKTALHLAASKGSLEFVQVLVANGADVEARTSQGKTAADLSTNEEVFSFLRQNASKIRPGPKQDSRLISLSGHAEGSVGSGGREEDIISNAEIAGGSDEVQEVCGSSTKRALDGKEIGTEVIETVREAEYVAVSTTAVVDPGEAGAGGGSEGSNSAPKQAAKKAKLHLSHLEYDP